MNEYNNQYPNGGNYQQNQGWNGGNYPQNWNNNNQNGEATAPMVLGILSLVTSIICCGGLIPIVLGIIGLALGGPAMKRNPYDSKAKSGVVLSAIGLTIGVIMTIVLIILSVNGVLDEIFYELDLF